MRKTAIAVLVLAAAFTGLWVLSRSRTFQLFGEIVPRVETERKVVALTFDDGPVSAVADELLATLARHDARATFFVCGAEMEKHRGAAARLVRAGHELGNHSWSHRRMLFKSPAFIRSEFERTDALIRAAGHRGAIHVRAPYCKKLVGLPWYFARNDRVHVTFDVEPESEFRERQKMAAAVMERVRPGSIILLHPWYRSGAESRAVVPLIIEQLRARGYELVTVSELLKLRRA